MRLEGLESSKRITGMRLAAGQVVLVLADLQHLDEDNVLHLHQVDHECFYLLWWIFL